MRKPEVDVLSEINHLGCVFCFKIPLGANCGELSATGKLETFDFPFNSTNMTHFAYGIVANAVAVLLYGSNFVPVKRIETGDGRHTAILFLYKDLTLLNVLT